jgi:hypothetical protein
MQVERSGRLDPKELAVSFGMSLALPAAMSRSRAAVRALPVLAEHRTVAAVGSHVAAGGVAASFDAGRQQLLTGRIDSRHVAHAGVMGAGLSGAGDVVRKAVPEGWRPGVVVGAVRREAAAPRQTLDAAMRNGVDLGAHEGPTLGHTLERHIGKPFSYLQYRLDTSRLDVASTFSDRSSAQAAITAVLRQHPDVVAAVDAGVVVRSDALRARFPSAIGKVLFADGRRLSGHTCRVILENRGRGGYVLTAMVEP